MKPKLPASATAIVSLLATMFITTSSALNLQNFQEVRTGSVPSACLAAYDASIPSCTVADFGSGHFCSSSCISALTELQGDITTACHGVTVASSTLLGMVFDSQLVNAICSVSSSSSAPVVAATSAISTLSSVVATSTTAEPIIAPTPEQTTTQQSTTTSTTTTTIHSATSLPSTISTFTSTVFFTTVSSTSSAFFSSISSLSVTTALTSTSTSISSEPKATSSKKSGLSSEQMEELTAMKHSGGGSPFDIFVSPATRIKVASGVCMIVVVGWIGIWAL